MEATAELTPTTGTEPSSTAMDTPTIPEAVPATPASSRPTSMRDALERVGAAQADSTAASPAPAAIAQPAVPGQPASPPSATPAPGPIPFEVHHTALANARTKSIQERDAQWMERYGWATRIEPQVFQEWSGIAQRMTSDPAAHLREFVTETLQHPTYGSAVRAELSRLAAGVQTASPATLDPDVQIVDSNGTVQGATYSADRVKAIVERAVAEAIGKEVAPLQHDQQRRQHQERQEAARAQANETSRQINETADQILADIADILDNRQDLFPAVDALMAEHPELSAHKAALQVRKARIVPTQQSAAQAGAVDVFKKKAAANTADGRVSASAPPKRLTGHKDIAQFLRDREAASA